MKYAFVLAFSILALIQWFIPGKLIWEKGQVLKKGQPFKFKTEPVDPSNPFKGKYITLNFRENSFTDTVHRNFRSDETVYVILNQDSAGFVFIKNVSSEKPAHSNSFVKANVSYISEEKDSVTIHLNYPFDEFYMEEFKAPKAEEIYRESNRDTTKVTYALVRILDGEAVLENVFIDSIPIGQMIK